MQHSSIPVVATAFVSVVYERHGLPAYRSVGTVWPEFHPEGRSRWRFALLKRG